VKFFFVLNVVFSWKICYWGEKKFKLEKIIACSEFIPPTFKTLFKQNKVQSGTGATFVLGEFSQPAKNIEKLFCNYFLKENFDYTCCYSGK